MLGPSISMATANSTPAFLPNLGSSFCAPCACKAAKKRLADVQKAKVRHPFAEASYDQAKGKPVKEIIGPGGKTYKNITDDAEALKKYGLSPKDMTIEGSHFQAAAFVNDDGQLIVSYKGSDPNVDDWEANFKQGTGKESQYYTRARTIANKINQKRGNTPPPPEFVGHSLGGGLASAAAAATGYSATTYNAAGLHANNIPLGVTPQNIQAVKVKGEILTGYANKLPGAPDTFHSEETLLDPPLSFGRDVVAPYVGRIVGGLLGSLIGPISSVVGAKGGAIVARGVMLHLNGAIKDSLEQAEKKAQKDVDKSCN